MSKKIGLGKPNTGIAANREFPQSSFQHVPPPAKAISGLSGNPPIPPGRPILVRNPLPDERAVLEQLGWEEGDHVPENFAAIIEHELANVRDVTTMPPPADPRTPKLQVPEPADIRSLPPERQAYFRDILANAQAEAAEAQQSAKLQHIPPDIRAAASGENVRKLEVEDDRPQQTYTNTNVPKRTRVNEPVTEGNQNTGAQLPLTRCPRCSWDCNQPDPITPTNVDKQNFLASLLGDKPFQKLYNLMDDHLQITLRTLRPDELDLCFRQIYIDRKHDKVNTQEEFLEGLMRYRLALQLVDVRTPSGEVISFYDNLADWGGEASPGETVLPQILATVSEYAIRNESMQRILGAQLAIFNRLAAKLEVNAHTEGFWKAIESAT